MDLPQPQFDKLAFFRQEILPRERLIRSLIVRRCGPEVLRRTSVEDLVQETLAEVFAGLDGFVFSGEGALVGWLSSIVRSVITHVLRGPHSGQEIQRIRGPRSSGAGISESRLIAPDKTPSSIVIRDDHREAILRALYRLPAPYSRVLQLYLIDQHPLPVVAAAMNRSKGAICRLMSRALQSLRLQLNGNCRSRDQQERAHSTSGLNAPATGSAHLHPNRSSPPNCKATYPPC